MRLELGKHVMLYLEGNYNAFALVTTSQIRTQREKGKQPILKKLMTNSICFSQKKDNTTELKNRRGPQLNCFKDAILTNTTTKNKLAQIKNWMCHSSKLT